MDLNTLLLLHCNGSDGSTTFTDTSTFIRTVTANGDAQVSTAQSQFGGASALFDGTGDYLSVADSDDWDYSGDFTIDFWFRPISLASGTGYLWCQGSDTDNFIAVIQRTTSLRFYGISGGVNFLDIQAGSLSVNTWYHAAAVRNGSNFYLFLDGTTIGTATDSTAVPANTAGPTIGRFITADFAFNGYIDEIRCSNVARWTADFTPPISEYSDAPAINRFRASVPSVFRTFRSRVIVADGSISQGDRQVIGWNYYRAFNPSGTSGSNDTKLLLMFVGR